MPSQVFTGKQDARDFTLSVVAAIALLLVGAISSHWM